MKKKLTIGLMGVMAIAVVLVSSFYTKEIFAQATSDKAVSMEIENNVSETTKKGDIVLQKISLKNTSNEAIENSMLSFILPEGLELQKDDVTADGKPCETLTFDEEKGTWNLALGADEEAILAENDTTQVVNNDEKKVVGDTSLNPENTLKDASQTQESNGSEATQKITPNTILSNASIEIELPVKLTGDAQKFSMNFVFSGNIKEQTVAKTMESQIDLKNMDANQQPNLLNPTTKAVKATTPTNPIKWKVVYKDAATGSGVIMPVDVIRDMKATASAVDNTATSFTRDGKDYANAYLASDLADWTYNTFALGLSETVGNTSYSDAKGQQLLKNNAYLSNTSEMSDYTKSKVYNLPWKNSESYTTPKASFTYPSNWISINEIATSFGISNLKVGGDAIPILASSRTFFGSTPNSKAIESSADGSEKELISVKADGSVYNPYYHSGYGNRPAVYIENLGALEENETFSLGATGEAKGWSVTPAVKDGDATYTNDGAVLLADAIAGKKVGSVSSTVAGVTYAMKQDADSANFSVDASGNVTLKAAVTKSGVYPFSVLVTKGVDTVIVKGNVAVGFSSPIKWKVVYKDANTGSGVIMPIDYIRSEKANATTVDNTAASFTRDGKDYANAYLASDLANWTYQTFATGLSATANVQSFSDARGQQLLKDNAYLTNANEMSDYTKSKVYNLPWKNSESYTTAKASFTYPSNWISITEIAAAHGINNISILGKAVPILASSSTCFGSTPNSASFPNHDSTPEKVLLSIKADGSIYTPYYHSAYGNRPAVYIENLGTLEENETFSLGATEEAKGWSATPAVKEGDATFTAEGTVSIYDTIADKKIGAITSSVTGVTYTMNDDEESAKFSVDASGNVTLKQAQTTPKEYPFKVLVKKGVDTVVVKGSLTVTGPTNPIKWKVVYKNASNGSGVIMPVDSIRKAGAIPSGEVDNTGTSFTRDGKDYANGYLSSDLAYWTYNTFALGFSGTVGNETYSDAKGQQLLKDNAYLSVAADMRDITKSNVYNLPYKSNETYTTPKASFTYPSNWISITEIATAHGHANIGISKDPDPILASSGTVFGSTPNSSAIDSGCSTAKKELLSLKADGSLYDPYYGTVYGNRPAVYVQNLGTLEENETFSLGATDEKKGWTATSEVKDGDATYSADGTVALSSAIASKKVGSVTSSVTGVTYAMKADTDSANFSVDASGNVTLKANITTTGVYPFTVLVNKGVDTILVKGSVTIVEDNVSVIKVSDGSEIGSFGSFKDANAVVTTKDEYKIQFLKDYTLDASECAELQKFLTDKTSSYILTGIQKDGTTISTVTIDNDVELGGNTSTQGNLIENIKLKASKDLNIYAGSVKTTFGDGITVTGKIALLGGKNSPSAEVKSDSTNLIVKSGAWYKLIGGGLNNTITGDVNLTITGSASVSSYYAVGGANTLNDAHIGEVKGMSNLTISGNVSMPVTYAAAMTPIGLSTVYGANINGMNITIEGDATVTGNLFLGAYSYYNDLEKLTHIAYYNYKGAEVHIKDNATITGTIAVESRMLAGGRNQWDVNGNKVMEEDCNIYVEGGKEIATLGSVATAGDHFSSGGKTIVNVNSTTKIKKIMNVNEVNVGATTKTDANIDALAVPNVAEFTDKINVSLANDSSLTLGAVNNTINNLTSTGNNSLKLSKPTSTSPLNIEGTLQGDRLSLNTTGSNAAGDVLLKFTTVPNNVLSLVKSADATLLASLKKADNKIVFTAKGNLSASTTKVKQKELELIDGTTPTPAKKDVDFAFSNEDTDYIYGNFTNGDATHSDAYVSTSEVADTTWLNDGTIPTNATKVTLTNTNGVWTGTVSDMPTTSATCYYLHVRNEQGDTLVTPIDVNGVHASAKAGSQAIQDGKGLNYKIELIDSTITPNTGTYTSSGIHQAAFALHANNQKALEDVMQANAGTADELYGIQTWTTGNVKEEYDLTIPETLLNELKTSTSKIVYLYAKDTLGNTTVSSVYVGDDLMNVNVPTKASVIALKGNKKEVVAPVLNIYNLGLQNVNIKMGMKNYADSSNTLKLVDDKPTTGPNSGPYAGNELALSVYPIMNTTFTQTNIRKIEGSKYLDLGSVNVPKMDSNLHWISYSFSGDYDATNISDVLQENSFTLEYYLTPISVNP